MKGVRQNSFLSSIISIIISFSNLLPRSHNSQQCFQCLLCRIFLWSTVTFNASDGQEIQNHVMWERIEGTRRFTPQKSLRHKSAVFKCLEDSHVERVLFPIAWEVTVGTCGMDTMGEEGFSSAKGRTQSYFNKGKNVPPTGRIQTKATWPLSKDILMVTGA